jgi:hypothetical protein
MKVIGARWDRSGGGRRRKRAQLGGRERRRLAQLLCCLALFFVTLVGRGAFPEQTAAAGGELLAAIRGSVDFQGAFHRLGEALEARQSLSDAVGEFCVTVFGVGTLTEDGASEEWENLMEEELAFLAEQPDGLRMICRRLWLEEGDLQRAQEPADDPAQEPEETAATWALGEVIQAASYTGQALPEGVTMDHLSLGTLAWVTPVSGTVTSGFGYRDHPVYGDNRFHHGMDIGAELGTDILAFADGVVDYVGESSSYGLYLQLDHGDGIKSFYAHCDSLAVTKGDTVAAGQKIGTVGETGNATGPHLHFQLSLDGTELDPGCYITPE